MLIGGDFTMLRKPEDKNNDNYDPKWPNLFNSVIKLADLREINLSGRLYTWANDLMPPTFEQLDRCPMDTSWDLKYPKVHVKGLDRSRSDHTPLLLNTGASFQCGSHNLFKFELGWLTR